MHMKRALTLLLTIRAIWKCLVLKQNASVQIFETNPILIFFMGNSNIILTDCNNQTFMRQIFIYKQWTKALFYEKVL